MQAEAHDEDPSGMILLFSDRVIKGNACGKEADLLRERSFSAADGAEQLQLVAYNAFHCFNFVRDQRRHGRRACGEAFFDACFSRFVDIRENVDLAYALLHGCPEIRIRQTASAMQHQRQACTS